MALIMAKFVGLVWQNIYDFENKICENLPSKWGKCSVIRGERKKVPK